MLVINEFFKFFFDRKTHKKHLINEMVISDLIDYHFDAKIIRTTQKSIVHLQHGSNWQY